MHGVLFCFVYHESDQIKITIMFMLAVQRICDYMMFKILHKWILKSSTGYIIQPYLIALARQIIEL